MIPEKDEKQGLTVWLYGEPIGILHRGEPMRRYDLAFSYLTETARPFSAAYPNPDANGEPARYTGAGLYQWFNNLLPERKLREAFRIIAHADDGDVYGLIKGNSAAEYIGAIGFTEQQSVQDYRGLEQTKRFTALFGNAEITRIIPLEGSRSIALAGATRKTGVTIDAKGHWYYPGNDSSHSTHVLKVNLATLQRLGLEIVEVCTQETLRRLDIDAAETELAVVKNTQAVLSKRFDRVLAEADSLQVAPIHQEDLMAAAGGSPDNKHVEDSREMEWAMSLGYPKLAALLHRHSEHPEKEKRALARLVAATYLIGDSDKHPKNIALLHSESNEPFRVTLAPAYDTVSVYCLKDMDFSQNQAIPIGHQYLRSRISAGAIRQFAGDIGLDAEAVKNVFQDVAETMPDAFNEVAAEKLKSEPILDRDRAKTSLDMTMKRINRECKRLLQVYRQRRMNRSRRDEGPWH